MGRTIATWHERRGCRDLTVQCAVVVRYAAAAENKSSAGERNIKVPELHRLEKEENPWINRG
jgi:hypothetical protein